MTWNMFKKMLHMILKNHTSYSRGKYMIIFIFCGTQFVKIFRLNLILILQMFRLYEQNSLRILTALKRVCAKERIRFAVPITPARGLLKALHLTLSVVVVFICSLFQASSKHYQIKTPLQLCWKGVCALCFHECGRNKKFYWFHMCISSIYKLIS